MYEYFNEEMHDVIDVAREASATYKQQFVDTEHILLGLIADEGGVAGETLALYGVTDAMVRLEIDNLIGSGTFGPEIQRPFAPDVKRLNELAQLDVHQASRIVRIITVRPGNYLGALCATPRTIGYRVLEAVIGEAAVLDMRSQLKALMTID